VTKCHENVVKCVTSFTDVPNTVAGERQTDGPTQVQYRRLQQYCQYTLKTDGNLCKRRVVKKTVNPLTPTVAIWVQL